MEKVVRALFTIHDSLFTARSASLALFLCTLLAAYGEGTAHIGAQTWFSSGAGEWQIGGNISPDLAVRSRLEWDDLESVLLVLKADCPLTEGIRLSAAYGTGDIEDGSNTDSDWFLTPGFNSGAFKFSESNSETDGQTTFLDINIIMSWFPGKNRIGERLYLDIIFGYQSYEDQLTDHDGIQTIVDEMPVYEPFGGQNATYNFKWESYRAGVHTDYLLTSKTTVSANAAVLLGVTHKGEGFWNLRTDMRPEPPNLVNEADSGWGADLTLRLSHLLTHDLSVEIGWKSLYIESDDGIHTSFLADGSIEQAALDTVKSSRNGFFAGITSHF